MSKELEALYRLTSHECMTAEEFDSLVAIIKQVLTPPTEQEVCEALSDELGEEIIYMGFDFINVDRTKIAVQFNLKNKNIEIYAELPPHLITMIGQFYEGKVKENE